MKPYLKYAIFWMGMCMYLCGTNLGRSVASPLPVVNPADFVFKDSLTLAIDSVTITGDYLVFSVMAYRPNDDWKDDGVTNIQDTILGHLDMYFTLTDAAFDKTTFPVFERLSPYIDNATTVGNKNMLKATTQYWAYRYNIIFRATYLNSDAGLLSLPLRQWIELCRVRMKMTDPTQNPGLQWDQATAGNSSIGEPIELTLVGDIIHNPDSVIHLEDHSKELVACEGECSRIWAKGHTSGSQPTFSWYLSDQAGTNINGYELVASYDGPVSSSSPYVKNGVAHTSFGDLNYSIISGTDGLERVDTLEICPSPGFLDSMYFRCQLSDPSLAVQAHTGQPIQVTLRDSIWGYLTSSTSADYGASAKTDTVVKCMESPLTVRLCFFGRGWKSKAEMKAETGGQLRVYYTYKDESLNVYPAYGQEPFYFTISDIDAQVQELAVKSPQGTSLFEATLSLPDSVSAARVWVSGIETASCGNGGSYAPYDTIYVREVLPDEEVILALTPRSVSTGETISLDKSRPYTDVVLKIPALGKIDKKPGVDTTYTAPATCNPGDVDTVVYTYAKDGCSIRAEQEIQINEWMYLSAKVYLEGAFVNNSKLLMETIPISYLPMDNFNHLKSPYQEMVIVNKAPKLSDDLQITDWVEIILRDASNIGTVFKGVDTVSAFLRQDGVICDTAGNPWIKFKGLNSDEYHVVIKHRNHLGVMSKTPIKLAANIANIENTILFDATDDSHLFRLYPTRPVLKNITIKGTTLQALYVGDVNADGQIQMGDVSGKPWGIMSNYTNEFGYWNYDVNFDLVVTPLDIASFMLSNANMTLNQQY